MATKKTRVLYFTLIFEWLKRSDSFCVADVLCKVPLDGVGEEIIETFWHQNWQNCMCQCKMRTKNLKNECVDLFKNHQICPHFWNFGGHFQEKNTETVPKKANNQGENWGEIGKIGMRIKRKNKNKQEQTNKKHALKYGTEISRKANIFMSALVNLKW